MYLVKLLEKTYKNETSAALNIELVRIAQKILPSPPVYSEPRPNSDLFFDNVVRDGVIHAANAMVRQLALFCNNFAIIMHDEEFGRSSGLE